APPAPTAPARLLVVDADPGIRDLLAEILGAAGYAVVTAADGEEALREAAQTPPDLVLLDVAMPGMDGYEVCRRLLADLAGARLPAIVFLTARADTPARVAGLDAGAVDYVLKPFEPDELEARIRAALRGKWERDALAAAAATDPLTGLANRGE